MARASQKNLLDAIQEELDDNVKVNPDAADGKYTYYKDLAVILRCLIADHTEDEIVESVTRHGYKGEAYRTAVRFVVDVHEKTRKEA